MINNEMSDKSNTNNDQKNENDKNNEPEGNNNNNNNNNFTSFSKLSILTSVLFSSCNLPIVTKSIDRLYWCSRVNYDC